MKEQRAGYGSDEIRARDGCRVPAGSGLSLSSSPLRAKRSRTAFRTGLERTWLARKRPSFWNRGLPVLLQVSARSYINRSTAYRATHEDHRGTVRNAD